MRYSVQKKYRVSRFFMARLKSSKLVVKSLFLKPQSACNYCIYGTFEEITYFSYKKINSCKIKLYYKNKKFFTLTRQFDNFENMESWLDNLN